MQHSETMNHQSETIDAALGVEMRIKQPSEEISLADVLPTREGLLATVRTQGGSLVPGKLEPDHIVRHNGVPMRLAMAEQLGFVRRGADGEYEEVPQAEYEAVKARADKAAAERIEQDRADVQHLPKESGAFLDGLSEALSATGQRPEYVVMEVLADADAPTVKAKLAKAADAMGLSREEFSARFNAAATALLEQANALLVKAGVDPQEVWAFEEETVPNHLKYSGYLRHLQSGDMTYYRRLVADFKRLRNPRPDLGKLPEGVTLQKTNDGRPFVRVPGYPPMSPVVARRLRLI